MRYTPAKGSEATTVQVHADAENFGYHMSLVADHVRAPYEYLDYLRNALGILAPPTAEILDQMCQLAGSSIQHDDGSTPERAARPQV